MASSVPPFAPTHDTLAEQAVLASMMLSAKQARWASTSLRETDFYHSRHRVAFRVLSEMTIAGEDVNLVTFIDRLRKAAALDGVGGVEGVLGVHEFSVPACMCPSYGAILREKRILRELANEAHTIGLEASGAAGTPEELISSFQARLAALGQDASATRPLLTAADAMVDLTRYIEDVRENPSRLDGVSTGFPDLDRKLGGGFFSGNLIVLAARPMMGKTSLAMNVVEHLGKRANPALLFSAEMPGREIWGRSLGGRLGMSVRDLQAGRFHASVWRDVIREAGEIATLTVTYDETPNIRVEDLCRKAIGWARGKTRGLVVVDYLQLLKSAQGGRAETREREVASLSSALKGLAGEIRMPVLALAQLNRELERRDNKRPKLSDLRDSGQIEQDADTVLFLYRDAVYGGQDPTEAEVIVGKQRNGELGTVMLRWDAERTRFLTLGGPEDSYHNGSER